MSAPWFLSLIDPVLPDTVLTIDSVRDEVEARQLTNHERGQCFRDAVSAGYLVATRTVQPSTHPPAKGRLVERYVRTTKRVPESVVVAS